MIPELILGAAVLALAITFHELRDRTRYRQVRIPLWRWVLILGPK